MSATETERCFLDTNILVYSDDLDEQDKNRRALQLLNELLRNGTGVVSTQVMSEYYVNVTRKFKTKVSPNDARRKLELLSHFEIVAPRYSDVLAAIDLSLSTRYSFWDCLIVRAAVIAGCRTLLTEDLEHGRVISGVEIVNPFL